MILGDTEALDGDKIEFTKDDLEYFDKITRGKK